MTDQTSGQFNGRQPHHIAIIGGRKSGKTTLCASLHQSLLASAHGFSPNMVARFPDATGLAQLDELFALKFAANTRLFHTETKGPVRKIRIGIDFSSSKWTLLNRGRHLITGFYPMEIDDLRDDFDLLGFIAGQPGSADSAPQQEDQKKAHNSKIQQQLTESLTKASSLIICHPAGQHLAPSERNGFIRLMSDIAIGCYGAFDSIIIAFTKYEQLFLKAGTSAFRKATDPVTILEMIHQTIKADLALENGLKALNCHDEDSPNLYAMPVSGFGFLRHNGAANFDPRLNAPLSAMAPQYEPPRPENPLKNAMGKTRIAGFTVPQKQDQAFEAEQNEARTPHPSKHWMPFLSADPFLTAASGLPSKFMIPLGQFLDALEDGIDWEEMRQSA